MAAAAYYSQPTASQALTFLSLSFSLIKFNSASDNIRQRRYAIRKRPHHESILFICPLSSKIILFLSLGLGHSTLLAAPLHFFNFTRKIKQKLIERS